MEASYPQRGRSPSGGASQNIRRSPSPSPNTAFTSQANAFGNDPSLLGPANSAPLTDSLNPQQQHHFQQQQYLSQAQYAQPQGLDQASYSYADSTDQSQQAALATQFMSQPHSSSFGNLDDPNTSFGDASADGQDFDSSLYLNFDQSAASSGADNANPYGAMATTHHQAPEPPHMLQHDMRQSNDSGVQSSPAFYQDTFNSGSQSRPTSLSPSSAAYMQGNSGDFSAMSFQGHRRLPSDQHSDVSSTHASPYLPNQDSFDGQSSPMINGNQDHSILGPDNLGLSQFSLSDHQQFSPAHSSQPSPNLGPSQGMPPLFNNSDGLGMMGLDDQFSSLQGQDSYATGQEAFPQLQPPPEITFDPAPPSKQPSFNDANPAEWALSPPDRAASRNRQRARSVPHSPSSAVSSREPSPARIRSPSDGGLRPGDNTHSRARSTSPSGPPGGVQKSYRRESSPAGVSVTERQAILERANSPQPPAVNENRASSPTPSNHSNVSNDGSAVTGPKRAQKHPATFQCHLCPKRFTRAYNLRSHLRTHTDERPFVCTVCGKAFARQHDRKRHEGLHSGEKKFVCRGILSTPGAGSWGCGRQFARADALGRHFRSEAGRSCIKPLLDEEARDKNHGMMGHGNHGMMDDGGMAPPGGQQPMMSLQPTAVGPTDFNGNFLPAVLLQQYPALAGISWDGPPTGSGTNSMAGGDYEGSNYDGASDYGDAAGDFDYSGRSSFEAYDDDETGYKSDAGYGSTLDPSYAQNHLTWQMTGGTGVGANGYYSDRGGQ